MPLESDADVSEIDRVVDVDGNQRPPADADKQERVAGALENETGINALEYTTGGTAAEALPAQSIPDGVGVSIQAKSGNAGDVFVGDSTTQASRLTPDRAITLYPSDLSAIYIQTPNAGDGVNIIHEA